MAERLFGTDGLRGPVNIYPMTVDVALRLGLAAGVRFRKGSHQHRVVIGKDTRLSGYMFESALTAGLCAAGMHVIMTGPLPTPAISFLTRNMRADLGVVISASHNPYSDNGIKFFDADGFKLPDEVENEISAMVLDPDMRWPYPDSNRVGRASKIEDAGGRYIVYTKSCFPAHLTLSGLRIVIDCANGAAYKVAPLALEELGAEVFRLGTNPNGTNINDHCGSTHLDDLAQKVVAGGYDIGVAFDGDADRCLLVDEQGGVIDGDKVLAVCGSDMKRRGKLSGGTIVATVMSNLGLHEFCRENGVGLVCTSVGDRNVLEKMNECGYKLGGEQSGHTIFTDYATTGDGQLTALQFLDVLVRSGKKASELASVCPQYPQVLLNVAVSHERGIKDAIMASDALSAAIAEEEGKLSGEGRVLVRPSGTEALIRVMVEAKTEQIALLAAENLVNVIKML